jgi:hypothetical protein
VIDLHALMSNKILAQFQSKLGVLKLHGFCGALAVYAPSIL